MCVSHNIILMLSSMYVHYKYKQTCPGGQGTGCLLCSGVVVGGEQQARVHLSPDEKSNCIAMVTIYNCTTNKVIYYVM